MARTAVSPISRDGAKGSGPTKSKQTLEEARAGWREAFRRVRDETEARAAHLSAEDQIVQSMADASPTKWHRAHVTWFFETFLLMPHDATQFSMIDLRSCLIPTTSLPVPATRAHNAV
jgi:hypothetical protein